MFDPIWVLIVSHICIFVVGVLAGAAVQDIFFNPQPSIEDSPYLRVAVHAPHDGEGPER